MGTVDEYGIAYIIHVDEELIFIDFELFTQMIEHKPIGLVKNEQVHIIFFKSVHSQRIFNHRRYDLQRKVEYLPPRS